MQTIKIDLAKRMICPVILAQQGDVGRKIKIEILDNGQAYAVPAGTTFSAWYEGTSGSGNYTHIGEESAFEISGNTVTVELITQMLTNAGNGQMTIVMHGADGTQLGSLQLPYWTEGMPGTGSEGAQQYYTAFQQMVKEAVDAAATFKTDTTLSETGKAADAAATGTALEALEEGILGCAPAGYGLGVLRPPCITSRAEVDNLLSAGWWEYDNNGETCCGYAGTQYGGILVVPSRWSVTQFFFCRMYYGCYLKRIRQNTDAWGEWEWVNPPMNVGTEYRTTERHKGQTVYTTVVDCGSFPSASTKTVTHGLSISKIIRCSGMNEDYFGIVLPYTEPGTGSLVADVSAHKTGVFVKCAVSTWTSYRCLVQLWYTK